MDQPNPTFAKIPILDTGKFEQWKFRIQQYLQNEHYSLWEVIEFGDSYKAPLVETGKGPASESSAKKKGRTLRFSKYETAKELWEAILKTFGGNEATKKTKKNQLKQQYGNFKPEDDLNKKFLTSLAPEWLMYTIVWRNKDDLNTMSLDDVYNHLKVFEPEVQKKSESNSQSMAFISSSNTSSGKGEVHTASVPTASIQVSTASADVAAASLSHDTVCAYIASKSNVSQIKYEDITQIDEDDIKEMDIQWIMALLSMRADRFWKKTGKKITIQGSDVEENHALVADDESPTEFALMAKSSSSLENEVEARLVKFKEQEIKFCEKIRGLERDVEDLDNLLGSQRSDKNKEGLGYNAVPPSLPLKSIHLLRKIYLGQHGESSGSIMSKPMIKFVKAADCPRVTKTNNNENARKSTVKYAEMYRNTSKSPKVREHNIDFHQIVDFLEASHIRQYTKRDTWIAQSKALFPAADEPTSLSRDDSQGEAFPTVSSFDAGQNRENINKTSVLPHESSPRVTSLDADDGSMQQRLQELMELCTSLQRQQSQMAAQIKDQDLEISSLKARELGEEVGADKSTELGSNDTEEMVNVLSSMEAANILTSVVAAASVSPVAGVSTAGVPTVSGSFPTIFVPMKSKEESKRVKRQGLKIDQGGSKRMKTYKDVSEEDLKGMMQLVPLEEVYVEALQATKDKEKELWVELKRLFEPDFEDQLWTHNQSFMHDPLDWKLYDACGVHHVFTKDQEIFMLVQKDYPLRRGLATVMICNKLQDDTTYLCLHFAEDHERTRSNTLYPENSIRRIQDIEGFTASLSSIYRLMCVNCHQNLRLDINALALSDRHPTYHETPSNRGSRCVFPTFPFVFRLFKTLCFFNYALMIRQDYDITSSLRRGALQFLVSEPGYETVGSKDLTCEDWMVNTRTDTDLSAAVRNALQTLLPQIREEIREEFRTGSGSSNAGGNPPPVTIHTWLERFNKQKPHSFEKATVPVDAENWIFHMENIFDVMGCDDAFKTRLNVYKFEGNALAWCKAYKQAKGGDAWLVTVTWADFKKLFFLQFFPRAEQERLKREYHSILFAPVARIKAIRLFLAYASFMGFIVYKMDVKSAFLYGRIEEEVYVCQPLGFEGPDYPDKVYKVKKALY
nr:hypothetical protein [Tanacetum cinerariifolium]